MSRGSGRSLAETYTMVAQLHNYIREITCQDIEHHGFIPIERSIFPSLP